MLLAKSWKHCSHIQKCLNKQTQYSYYKSMNSNETVLQMVQLHSKTFGTVSEKILQEVFNLKPRTSYQHDGIKYGKKIEIKSARYWTNTVQDCKWQHIEPHYDFDILLLALLDFQGFKVWGMGKHTVNQLVNSRIITRQGKQGYWVNKNVIHHHLFPITDKKDLKLLCNGIAIPTRGG